jgi:Ran GTPase-activating protein 1
MASSNKLFSIEGKSLKLTTAEDIEPYIASLRAMEDLEEIRLLGNSLGVGACKALGEILATKKTLRVCEPFIQALRVWDFAAKM